MLDICHTYCIYTIDYSFLILYINEPFCLQDNKIVTACWCGTQLLTLDQANQCYNSVLNSDTSGSKRRKRQAFNFAATTPNKKWSLPINFTINLSGFSSKNNRVAKQVLSNNLYDQF